MGSDKQRKPLVRKGATFPFQVAVACWIDLLGYGSMIAEAEFNPLHPKSSEALARLRRFHKIVAQNSARYFPTLVLNDGAVAYRDLSLRNRSVTHDFLTRAWSLFNDIKRDETVRDLPGARMVLAAGFRMKGRRAGIDAKTAHFKSVMQRFQDGKISASQAISEAASIKHSFDIIPQLQANFAFTKAYMAEAGGSKGGLKGPGFFVDLTLFDEPTPAWIVKEDTVHWSNERLGLKASFAPIVDLPRWKHIEGGPVGIKDGLQVAQHLARDVDVLSALRTSRKGACNL